MVGADYAEDSSEFVEVDPTGRYFRYNEILGKGASKIVYRAFDEYEGIEVAWNQVKLYDFLQSPQDLERLYCEIHLLKTLKHKNIMKFYTSWVDISNRNINFVTEMFTSGTLKQYRDKHKRINIRAIKNWCRQILRGLLYLHSHDPPVIHRDLKCDNIFVNGNQGVVKIGDLGLAAILRKSHAAHCVGTPEFMAPEVYKEEYNELVDIYSFGMCVLEMVTSEYPYSECTHPAQIYKKVISGRKPDALYKVKDLEVRQFIEKCLATVSSRLTARELLHDPFLQIDNRNDFLEVNEFAPILRELSLLESNISSSNIIDGCTSKIDQEIEQVSGDDIINSNGIEFFDIQDDVEDEISMLTDMDITIKGKMKEDGIFLRLRMADKEGEMRNIYFPFDIEADTALSVATEMISELDMPDQDVTKIAEMIDGEIAYLVPTWKPGLPETDNICNFPTPITYRCTSSAASNGSLPEYVSSSVNFQSNPSPKVESFIMHGRFEERTYQIESDDSPTEGTSGISTEFIGKNSIVLCTPPGSPGLNSPEAREDPSYQEFEIPNKLDENKHFQSDVPDDANEPYSDLHRVQESMTKFNYITPPSSPRNMSGDYGKEIIHVLRQLKAKCQIKLIEYKSKQIEETAKEFTTMPFQENHKTKSGTNTPNSELRKEGNQGLTFRSFSLRRKIPNLRRRNKICLINKKPVSNCHHGGYSNLGKQKAEDVESFTQYTPENMLTGKKIYDGMLFPPHSIRREKSFPVDPINIRD